MNNNNTKTLEIIAGSRNIRNVDDYNRLTDHYDSFRPTLDLISSADINKELNITRVARHTLCPERQIVDGSNQKVIEMTQMITKELTEDQRGLVMNYLDRAEIVANKLKISEQVFSQNRLSRNDSIGMLATDFERNHSIYRNVGQRNLNSLTTNSDNTFKTMDYEIVRPDGSSYSVKYSSYVDHISNYIKPETYDSLLSYADCIHQNETLSLLAIEHHLSLALGFSGFIAFSYCLHQNGNFEAFIISVVQKSYYKCVNIPKRFYATATDVFDNMFGKYKTYTAVTVSFAAIAFSPQSVVKFFESLWPKPDCWGLVPIIDNFRENFTALSKALGGLLGGITGGFTKGWFEQNPMVKDFTKFIADLLKRIPSKK